LSFQPVGHPALDQLSVPVVIVRNMAGDSKPKWWSKEARQVWAHYTGDGLDAPPRALPDGEGDKPASFDPQGRTYRQLTRASLMVCPMKGCEPFYTISQGVALRSHFRHETRREDELHRGGVESVWHLQAKFAVHDWICGAFDSAELVDLQLEYEHLPALRDGRRRKPDVYVEFKDGARVAFECQQQSMAGTDPRDHYANWQGRLADYRELREAFGLRVVWLVSPWATIRILQHEGGNVWRVEAFGGYGAQLLEEGETVYWIDPTFGQFGTLVEHVTRPRDVPIPRGYLKRANQFHERGKWYWLHSDNIIDCDIDPATGTVTTPTDISVQRDQRIAARHIELEAEKRDAENRERAAHEEHIRRQARERAAKDEAASKVAQAAARKWHERREAEAEFYRQIEAEAARKAQRQTLIRDAIVAVAIIALLVLAVSAVHSWLVG
jgi:hypothetical protein